MPVIGSSSLNRLKSSSAGDDFQTENYQLFPVGCAPSAIQPLFVAACPSIAARHILKSWALSRETIYGASVRAAVERATEARKQADRLAVEA